MRYIMAALLALAVSNITISYAQPNQATSEKINSLKGQMADLRMQTKAARAEDRVRKAVDKYCSAVNDPNLVICSDPFAKSTNSVMKPSAKR